MKLFILYAFVGIFAVVLLDGVHQSLADYSAADFNSTHEYCAKANNISDDEFKAFANFANVTEESEESDSKDSNESDDNDDNDESAVYEIITEAAEQLPKNIKCYALCIFEQMGALGDNDKIDLELIKKNIDDVTESSIEIVQKCNDMFDDEADACDYSIKVMMCLGGEIIARDLKRE